MGFREERERLITALDEGRFQNEIRGAVEEKNLLAIGEVSAQEVIGMLRRCRGDQHRSSPHNRDRNVREAWFISVHRSETGQ